MSLFIDYEKVKTAANGIIKTVTTWPHIKGIRSAYLVFSVVASVSLWLVVSVGIYVHYNNTRERFIQSCVTPLKARAGEKGYADIITVLNGIQWKINLTQMTHLSNLYIRLVHVKEGRVSTGDVMSDPHDPIRMALWEPLQSQVKGAVYCVIFGHIDDQVLIQKNYEDAPQLDGSRRFVTRNGDVWVHGVGFEPGREILLTFSTEIRWQKEKLARIEVAMPSGLDNMLDRYQAELIQWLVMGFGGCGILMAYLVTGPGIWRRFRDFTAKKNDQVKKNGNGCPELPENETEPDDTIPSRIGAYNVIRKLGQGAMASVYLATNPHSNYPNRKYAIKMANSNLSPQKQDAIDTLFKREAELAEGLEHGSIVRVWKYLKTERALVMEYIDGMDLGQLINVFRKQQRPIPIPVQVFMFQQICEGLIFCHENKRVLHRDIKPINIMVSMEGDVKIADFGVAKEIPDAADANASGKNETIIGTPAKGTPGYMAPEVRSGKPASMRSDIFSLGVVFYEMLTLQPVNRIHDGYGKEIQPISKLESDVPEALTRIVMKCLETAPEHRYGSVRALYVDLTETMRQLGLHCSKLDLADFMRTTTVPCANDSAVQTPVSSRDHPGGGSE